MTVLVPGSCLENHRAMDGRSKELEHPLVSLTLKTIREHAANYQVKELHLTCFQYPQKHRNRSREQELGNALCCVEMLRGRVKSQVCVGYWSCRFPSDVDILKQVISYSRIWITTLKVFKGSFSRTLSGKSLRSGYLLKPTKEYYQVPHLDRGES
jgi:hypothetical protein